MTESDNRYFASSVPCSKWLLSAPQESLVYLQLYHPGRIGRWWVRLYLHFIYSYSDKFPVLVIIMLAKGRGFISTKACSYLASTSDRSSGVFDTSNLGDLKTPLKSIVYIDGMHSQRFVWEYYWQEALGVLYYIALFLLSLTNLILNSVLPVRKISIPTSLNLLINLKIL